MASSSSLTGLVVPSNVLHAIRTRASEMGVEVRVGLHTGEVEVRGEDFGGIAVHIGARVAAAAGPGRSSSQGLLPTWWLDRVSTSRIGVTTNSKGVPNPWRLFAFVG